MENWIDIGSADELSATPLKRVTAMTRPSILAIPALHCIMQIAYLCCFGCFFGIDDAVQPA